MNTLLILLFSLFTWITGAEAPGKPQKAELLFVGDAMQHQGQLDRAREVGGSTYDYSDCFSLIAPTVIKADYAVVNLEVPLGGGSNYSGYPCFSAPDVYAEALKDAGFDLFLTANNHCLDRGDQGVRRTIDALARLKVDQIGTYHNASHRRSTVPFIKNIKGFKVGFLNYTYGTNGIKPKFGAEISLIDKVVMAREIKALREAGAELVTVCIHWGLEYVLTENAEQRDLADFLNSQGVDLIIGSHPHVIQPMKVVPSKADATRKVLVVYSLGNFISNMKTDDTRGGAMVRVILKRGSDGVARFEKAEYDTFYAAKPDGLRNYMVIPSWSTASIPAAQLGWWNTFNRRAENIFAAHNKDVPRAVARN